MADRLVMLVTGGSRGIGAAVALAAAGTYDVAVNYHEHAALAAEVVARVQARGSDAVALQADMADEVAVRAMFASIDQRFGRFDVLVNNAGIAGAYGTIDVVDSAMLQHLWAVNVTGAFVCSREASARMRTDRGGHGGSIVNITSKAAVLGGSFEWVHYAASKGALETMTTGLAKELALVGVRVNAVRPGLIDTDFREHAPEGRTERVRPTVPMQRSGTTEEVAAAVLWLASADASYVTGTFLDVTGGR